MSKLFLNENYKRTKLRIRNKVSGTEEKPRVTVFRSNKYIYGQVINDIIGKTLFTTRTSEVDKKVSNSFEAGKALAKEAVSKGIKKVVFDRNGYRYHGRVKSFAEGLREGGLEL